MLEVYPNLGKMAVKLRILIKISEPKAML